MAATQVWPALRILAAMAPGDGGVHVGVLEHQERCVAAELHRGPQHLLGGAAQQDPADLRGAGEGQLAQPRVAQQRLGQSAAEDVGTTLMTPVGRPRAASTSRTTSANSSVVSGVYPAGLTTTVHPAARAGATLRVAIASGKFHGVMSSAGPTAGAAPSGGSCRPVRSGRGR